MLRFSSNASRGSWWTDVLCVLIDSHVEGDVIRRAVSVSIGDVMNSADGHDDLANSVHYRQVYDCSESTQTQSAMTAHAHRSDFLNCIHSQSVGQIKTHQSGNFPIKPTWTSRARNRQWWHPWWASSSTAPQRHDRLRSRGHRPKAENIGNTAPTQLDRQRQIYFHCHDHLITILHCHSISRVILYFALLLFYCKQWIYWNCIVFLLISELLAYFWNHKSVCALETVKILG